MASRKTSRRTIKTVDDAREALVDLTPEGFTVVLDHHFSQSTDNGHTFTTIEFRAYAYKSGGGYKPLTGVKAHTPVGIVREYLATVVPLFNPRDVPAPKRPRRVDGPVVRRLTYDPQPAFRPGDLFS